MTLESPTIVHAIERLGRGGAEHYILKVAAQMSTLGWSSWLIAREGPLTKASDPRLKTVKPGYRYLGWGRVVPGLLQDRASSVVSIHSMAPLPCLRLWTWTHGVPLSFTFHTNSGRSLSQTARVLRLVRPDLVICVSSALSTALLEHGVQSQTIRNSIPDRNPKRELTALHSDTPNVVYVGRFDEVKRHDVLVEAFSKVLAAVPRAHLHLLGDGPLQARVQDQVAKMGLTHSVTFHGYRNPDEILGQATVFASASGNEGLSLAAIEALMWGVPLALTPTYGATDLIPSWSNGAIARGFSASDVAEAIMLVLSGSLTDMSIQSRLLYESGFVFDQMMEKISQAHLGVLSRWRESRSMGRVVRD